MIAAMLKAQPEQIAQRSATLGELVATIQSIAWWMVPALTIALPVLQWAKTILGDPMVWETIHKLLEEMRTKCYPEITADHHHRVTLFQHRRWCWRSIFQKDPFGGWLVPVERSGNTTRNPKIYFYAPSNDPDKARGFAGMVWANQGALKLERLPELSNGSKDAHFKTYAEKTAWLEPELRAKVDRGKILARSYWGTVVRRKGRVWGVVLIDSRDAELPDGDIGESFKPIGICINKLLEVL